MTERRAAGRTLLIATLVAACLESATARGQPTCSELNASVRQPAINGIALSDGPHEVICRLLDQSSTATAEIRFAVNGVDSGYVLPVAGRTYGEIVDEFWRQVYDLESSTSQIAQIKGRALNRFEGIPLSDFARGIPDDVYVSNIYPSIRVEQLKWMGAKFVAHFNFGVNLEHAVALIASGGPMVFHRQSQKNVLDSSLLESVNLVFAETGSADWSKPILGEQNKEEALLLLRRMRANGFFSTEHIISAGDDSFEIQVIKEGAFFRIEYREWDNFANLTVSIR